MAAGDPGSPARYYSSIAVETALSGSIPAQAQGAANTAFIVASVSGFPGSYPYTLIVDPDTSKEEVVTVYAGSGTTLSVYRGEDNTQGVAHSAGAVVRHGVSGRDFRESENHIAARGFDIDQTILDAADQTHVHGIATGDGVIVGTLKEQTLTRKTLTTPTVNGATITGTVTASTATFTSPTISGSPVITGLSSAGMVNSSATPKIYVDSILGSATAAATSAASAAASATAAATSAASAATSAGSSETSAISSATSATAAATSATSAAASATAAATSATSAAASATAAATSATSAAASATTAAASVATIAGYATSAANSASAAATSATSAAASATAAATSAASAATSASTMDASVTAAATSAASASASATAAATSATSAANSATAAATSATSAANSASASATSASAAATSATSAATSASSAATSASSAATTYDQFDDRYLGSKSSPPTVDNDGNTLLVGAIYWNDVLNNMYVWSGSAWVQIATTSVYTAPTLGSTTIASGTTYTTIVGLTLDAGLTTADPTVNLGIANKQYVDNKVNGLTWKAAANLRSTSNIALTGTAGTLVIDGHAALVAADSGYRILVNGQTTSSDNGIYTYSDNGSTYTLSRSSDADVYTELNGASVYILEGTLYTGTSWVQNNYSLSSFSGQDWVQFGEAITYSAGTGLTLTDSTFSIATGYTDDININAVMGVL
jgi:hypothetical protein